VHNFFFDYQDSQVNSADTLLRKCQNDFFSSKVHFCAKEFAEYRSKLERVVIYKEVFTTTSIILGIGVLILLGKTLLPYDVDQHQDDETEDDEPEIEYHGDNRRLE
jgi:hypothetical protein